MGPPRVEWLRLEQLRLAWRRVDRAVVGLGQPLVGFDVVGQSGVGTLVGMGQHLVGPVVGVGRHVGPGVDVAESALGDLVRA
jgi:hypothetical protein